MGSVVASGRSGFQRPVGKVVVGEGVAGTAMVVGAMAAVAKVAEEVRATAVGASVAEEGKEAEVTEEEARRRGRRRWCGEGATVEAGARAVADSEVVVATTEAAVVSTAVAVTVPEVGRVGVAKAGGARGVAVMAEVVLEAVATEAVRRRRWRWWWREGGGGDGCGGGLGGGGWGGGGEAGGGDGGGGGSAVADAYVGSTGLSTARSRASHSQTGTPKKTLSKNTVLSGA
ncbi:hypothetical protein CYMTET_32003 [Cymbomonas tetramitiformis]|uniref:Uncharacterized protein n=1 Tax=Cymbomonas tetramitiformis TaxID=36881 RepID=A0AAE0KSL5_9CHLO|nr:hypothetical protein CYMTET_32003 [Cymbomonas tetramitiformis]